MKGSVFLLVYLDFEMNGIFQGKGEMIRIGAIKVANGEVIDSFERYIHPVKYKEIFPEIKVLTGISNEDVQNAKSFGDVMLEFITWTKHSFVYFYGNTDKESMLYSLSLCQQLSSDAKKRILTFIEIQTVDLKPYFQIVDGACMRLSLGDLVKKKTNKVIDGRKLHQPIYDATLLWILHEYYKASLEENEFSFLHKTDKTVGKEGCVSASNM